MRTPIDRGKWVVALCCAPLLTGCASSELLRIQLEDRDLEVHELREEQMVLRDENARLLHESDALTESLQQALDNPHAARQEAVDTYSDLSEQGISVARMGDAVVFTVPSAASFGSGQATLTSSGQGALLALAERLRSDFDADVTFFVEGHTDSDPILHSGFVSNMDLSLHRAMAVLDHLVEHGGLPGERLVVVGYGHHSPVAPNDSTAAKARNRRVEVVARR